MSYNRRWEAALPEESRELLKDERESFLNKAQEMLSGNLADASLRQFPLVSTMAMNYSPELVGCLSNHTAWAVHELAAELKDLVGA